MTAGEQLKAWRGERTMRQAADLIGCDPSHISLLESGQRKRPGFELRQRLHDVAGIPLSAWSADTKSPQKRKLRKSVTTVNGRSPRASRSARAG